ncbi:SpoIVB peptidase [Amphibacillus xylanus]|uniref:SpoIVB peptidase n=1 Tax=Amphibacillus xylanus (strain ATCC 51415 / DSM 6626 / JCM 7361 / LMG 17667 / NBRC 15112 / Ep01) TaxID=698758 RepID=K0IY14_AMPXN|nr:SpoIVB peptidase [Amphibacillus xylanus]BAM47314.1 SpoIVB peptidase [Amphibacillus xylanus NBRC 15112]
MNRQIFKNLCGIALIIALLILPFIPPVKEYLAIPTQINLYTNQPETIEISTSNPSFSIIDQQDQQIIKIEDNYLTPLEKGKTELQYQYNDFPLKKINVNVDHQYQVIPGGQSIGVSLETLGVLVVGYHYIGDEADNQSPGREIGIKIGDNILEMNQHSIQSIEDIGPIVAEAGQNNESIQIKYQRDHKVFEDELIPVYDEKTDSYKIGLYIRDSAAGIGTMTFLDPQTNMYGALGHVIADIDTKEPIEIKSGTIVKSKITSIQKGNSGLPGEKRATFNKNENLLGNITKNSSFGVFGELDIDLSKEDLTEPIPIAYSHEVVEGPAQILTVIDDEKVEAFDIEIISTIEQKNPATKGMVIKVTDERLLEKTGGIVQGMSGSPIIQNNKLIGAVTHVFVNDPTSGYGIHIEWMLDEAEINYKGAFAKVS